ncbi:hypothetical protein N665_0453s0005 [Sinapis alba]|nr:hypothetical protein N665_0453s0005 [Sinapis alba]
MDSTPFPHTENFVEILNSQQDSVFRLVEGNEEPSSSKGKERKERRTWTQSDDVVLISAWLNTSKDPLVENEQCSGTFWKRIAEYYADSQNIARGEERGANNCKHRWQKINDLVSKFSGSYEAATREKRSSQNEVDVIKHAHEIFFNNYEKKFTLEHAWRELRYDQKWCGNEGRNKRRKFGDGSHSASESVKDNDVDVDDEGTNRPPGVKAAKARLKKKPMVEGKEVSDFQTMWSLKKEDMVMKEKLVKMKLLDKLLGNKEALGDEEAALKKKLILELMSD